MAKKQTTWNEAEKRAAIARTYSGESQAAVARDLGISAQTMRNWNKLYGRGAKQTARASAKQSVKAYGWAPPTNPTEENFELRSLVGELSREFTERRLSFSPELSMRIISALAPGRTQRVETGAAQARGEQLGVDYSTAANANGNGGVHHQAHA